jgi:hypothetical protein
MNKIKYIEINFVPLVKSAFPDETFYLDTRLSWDDGRGHAKATTPFYSRLGRLASNIIDALRLPAEKNVEAVVVRARGPENVEKRNLNYLFKKAIGLSLHRLARKLANKHACKLLVVDRTDEPTVHRNDVAILRDCDIYFKREMPWSIWTTLEHVKTGNICIGMASAYSNMQELVEKMRPLSLGGEDDLIRECAESGSDKCYDVFYVGKAYGMPRRLVIDAQMEELKQLGFRVFHPTRHLTRNEFLAAIAMSHIAISPGGVGWDCFRHYEIPACGTAMLIERPCHQAYAPPIANVEAIYYNPGDSIVPVIRHWLSKPEELRNIAISGKRWMEKHHAYSALGRQIVESLRQ